MALAGTETIGERRSLAWDGWGFAAWMAVLSIAGCAFMSFAVPHLIGSPHQWGMSDDVWATTNSAQYVANGGAGALYSANPWFSALPGFLYLYAPVVALGDHLHLSVGYPYPIPRPTMWLLTGPFFALVGSTTVLGVDYLADTLGLSRPRRRLLALGVALLAVAPTVVDAGHPEDLLAITLSCVSLSLLLRGRIGAAGYVLALAVTMQTWAGLLIPVLVAASPAGTRLRGLLRSALLPAALAVMLLASDWKDASLQLLRQPLTMTGQALPWEHLLPQLPIDYFGTHAHLLVGSTTRSVAVLAALAAAFYVYRRPSADRLMLAAAVVLYCRGIVEADYWPYYFLPGAIVLAVLGLWKTAGRPRRAAVGAVAAFAVYGSAPLAYNSVGYSPYVALFVLVASLLLCLGAAYQPRSLAVPGERVLLFAGRGLVRTLPGS